MLGLAARGRLLQLVARRPTNTNLNDSLLQSTTIATWRTETAGLQKRTFSDNDMTAEDELVALRHKELGVKLMLKEAYEVINKEDSLEIREKSLKFAQEAFKLKEQLKGLPMKSPSQRLEELAVKFMDDATGSNAYWKIIDRRVALTAREDAVKGEEKRLKDAETLMEQGLDFSLKRMNEMSLKVAESTLKRIQTLPSMLQDGNAGNEPAEGHDRPSSNADDDDDEELSALRQVVYKLKSAMSAMQLSLEAMVDMHKGLQYGMKKVVKASSGRPQNGRRSFDLDNELMNNPQDQFTG